MKALAFSSPILSCLLLLSCASAERMGDSAAQRQTFLCDRGQSIFISFKADRAILEADAQSFDLTRQDMGSAIRYVGHGHDLRGKGPLISWTDRTGAVRQCREQQWAMRQPQIQEPIRGLAGTNWVLVHFQSPAANGGTTIPSHRERYTLRFESNGALTARLDCNLATGRWRMKNPYSRGGTLTITMGPMTRAQCGPGAMDTQIARDLSHVRTYVFAGSNLNLVMAEGGGTYFWAPLRPADG